MMSPNRRGPKYLPPIHLNDIIKIYCGHQQNKYDNLIFNYNLRIVCMLFLVPKLVFNSKFTSDCMSHKFRCSHLLWKINVSNIWWRTIKKYFFYCFVCLFVGESCITYGYTRPVYILSTNYWEEKKYKYFSV